MVAGNRERWADYRVLSSALRDCVHSKDKATLRMGWSLKGIGSALRRRGSGPIDRFGGRLGKIVGVKINRLI